MYYYPIGGSSGVFNFNISVKLLYLIKHILIT